MSNTTQHTNQVDVGTSYDFTLIENNDNPDTDKVYVRQPRNALGRFIRNHRFHAAPDTQHKPVGLVRMPNRAEYIRNSIRAYHFDLVHGTKTLQTYREYVGRERAYQFARSLALDVERVYG